MATSAPMLVVGSVAPEVETSTVFIVDDDVVLCDSLSSLIRTAGWHPETFRSAEDFLSQSHSALKCCLVVGLTLAGVNGLELQRRLSQRPYMPIIFMTDQDSVPMTVQAMKGGAFEVLTKPLDSQALLNAVGTAIELSHDALRDDLETDLLRTSYAALTRREREVMGLVVSGRLNKQIGGELGISDYTVKAHRRQVMLKMNADSLADLVMMAARLGVRAAWRRVPRPTQRGWQYDL